MSGIIVPHKYELEQWRVYFQGRLTAPSCGGQRHQTLRPTKGHYCAIRRLRVTRGVANARTIAGPATTSARGRMTQFRAILPVPIIPDYRREDGPDLAS